MSAPHMSTTHIDAITAIDPVTELIERLPVLAACESEIRAASDLLISTFRAGGLALFAGNGGSAADAEHWTGELLKGFESRRPLSAQQREGLPAEFADKLQAAVPAIPLIGFPSLRTAVANDIDPLLEFAQLVQALGRPGSVFVGLSTSGNAANVCAAATVARARGMQVISLTGAGGGRLADLSNVSIRVGATRTCLVQELHLPVYHTICLAIEAALFS